MKKRIYYFIPCLIWAGVCFSFPYAAHAQGNYLKNAAGRAANSAKKTLSAAELSLKQSQLEALVQVRRELARTPSVIHHTDFKIQAELLKQLDIRLSYPYQAPELFAALSQKIDVLMQQTGIAVFPIALNETPRLRPTTKALSRWAAFEQAKRNKTPRFQWKTPSGETVYMGPAAFPKQESHPLYPCREWAVQATQGQYRSLSQIFERIFTSRLNAEQKLALARHLSQTAEAAGSDLTLRYINFFRQIPAVKAPGWLPPLIGKALATYVQHKENVLIEKLKQGQRWTVKDTNLLLDLAALLPQAQSRRLLAALTYLEPAASQWLLLFPQASPLTRSIEMQLQTAKTQGVISPKKTLQQALPSALAQKRLAYLYEQSTSYTELLSHLKDRIQSIELALKRTQKASSAQLNTPQAVAQRLYVEAYKNRLKNLQNKVWNRLEEIEAELNSLQFFTFKKS